MFIRVVSSDAFDGSYWTPKYWAGEVLNLVSEAAGISSTIESVRKDTGGFYSVVVVQDTEQRVSSTNFSSDLCDVTVASQTVGVSRGCVCVLHIILGRNPRQIT